MRSSSQRYNRIHQSGGIFLRKEIYQSGRRSDHLRDGTPFEFCSLAADVPGTRSNPEVHTVVTERGTRHGSYHDLVTEKTKLVAVTHVSNVLGTVNPVKEIIRHAHVGAILVLIDGAQAVSHMPVDVQDWMPISIASPVIRCMPRWE